MDWSNEARLIHLPSIGLPMQGLWISPFQSKSCCNGAPKFRSLRVRAEGAVEVPSKESVPGLKAGVPLLSSKQTGPLPFLEDNESFQDLLAFTGPAPEVTHSYDRQSATCDCSSMLTFWREILLLRIVQESELYTRHSPHHIQFVYYEARMMYKFSFAHVLEKRWQTFAMASLPYLLLKQEATGCLSQPNSLHVRL